MADQPIISKTSMLHDTFLNQRQAAQFLGVNPSMLAHLRKSGGGPPYVRIGRSIRYSKNNMASWLATRQFHNTAQAKFTGKFGSLAVYNRFPKAFPSGPLARCDVSYIYFIQSHSGHIKIGIAKDIENRMKKLQTGQPHPLRLLVSVYGDTNTEAEYHRRFADFRLSGEWFSPEKPLIDEIERLLAL